MKKSKLASELAATLEKDGERTKEFFAGMTEEDWQSEVYADGPAWRVHHLLAHFTEVEGSIPRLLRRILLGEAGIREGFDIDRHNAREVRAMGGYTVEELMGEFAKRRRLTVEMVGSMSDADLETSGRHPFLGKSKIKEMVRLMYLHLRIHQRDIRRALKKSKS